MIHTQKYIYMSKFYRLQGYLLCIVKLQQVTKVTKIVHKQRNKVMFKFYRLQGLLGFLLCIVKLRQVTKLMLQRLFRGKEIKLCPSFIGYKGY